MRRLRYSINVTLDGCVDHRAIIPNEDTHRHATESLERADALLFGRVIYQMMEEGWRRPVPAGTRPEWMEPFALALAEMGLIDDVELPSGSIALRYRPLNDR